MRHRLPQEFDFRREILPVVVVGLLLNLLGRYFASTRLSFTSISPDMPDFLFLDMAGTALVAFVAGPWWAAIVGILGSAFDGLYYTAYFPFGTVSIVGGLTWGYLARLPRVQRALALGKDWLSVRRGFYAYLLMVVSGAVVCDVVSAVVKAILYPRMGLPLDLHRVYYLHALQMAQAWHLPHSSMLSLLGADLVRELMDKALSVAVALAFLMMMGFVPSPKERQALRKRSWSRWDQLKTDAHPILLFAITYAVFLFVARMTRPALLYPDATQAIYWLQDPLVLFLLYTPIILAVTAFLLLSYDPTSSAGQALDADRKRRSALYRRLLYRPGQEFHQVEKTELFRVLRQESVYGLLATVLLWPQRLHVGGSVVPILLYFGVTVVFASVFFHERRQFSQRWKKARGWLDTTRGWMRLDGNRSAPEHVLHTLAEVLGKDLFMPAPYCSHHGSIWFLPCILFGNSPSLRDFAQRKRSDRVLLVLPSGPGNISERIAQDVRESMNVAAAETVILLTTTPEVVEDHLYRWLEEEQAAGREVILMGWEDVEAAIVTATRREDIGKVLARCRLRTLEQLSDKLEADTTAVPPSPDALVRRSLQGVQYVLNHLPPQSTVFDFGSGRGRHTLAAAAQGHEVLAVEKKSEVSAELERMVQEAAYSQVKVRCADYRQVTPEEAGEPDLVVITGVLQHASSLDELVHDLRHLRSFVSHPDSVLYVEMLFDMTFDGRPPGDGRVACSPEEFEALLTEEFLAPRWRVERVRGPYRRRQKFCQGPRSFLPPAQVIESTSIEYLIVYGG
jgi:uncharacterized membrane protein